MKAEWFAKVNDQEYGPYTWQQMLQMAAEGRVPADLPVKRVSDKKWFTAKQVPGLVEPAKPVATTASATPGRAAKDDSHLKRARPLTSSASSVAPPPPSSHPAAPPPPPPPVAPAGALGWPVIVAVAPRTATLTSAAAQPADHAPRRGTSRWMLAGILGSVAAVILVAGGAVIWLLSLRGETTGYQVVAAAQQKAESGRQNAGESHGNATPEESPDDKTKSESGSGPTKAELNAQSKTVKSISSWQSLAGVKSFGVSNASLQVNRIWRTNAAADEADKKAGGPYICVEVSIRNKSRSPLRYKGWNSYGESGAILADENDEVLPLVPIEKTPDLTRLTRTSVPGSGAVTELLVFKAPAGEDEVLHLVLPYGVFYSNVRPPYRAIELTPDVMGIDLTETATAPPAVADAAQAPEAKAGAGPASTQPPELEVPPTSSPGAKPPTKDAKPPSLRDQINNEPGAPARPDDPPPEKGEKGKEKDASKKGEQPQTPKKPENPFEPKGKNPLDPLSVVPKGEEPENEP